MSYGVHPGLSVTDHPCEIWVKLSLHKKHYKCLLLGHILCNCDGGHLGCLINIYESVVLENIRA